MNRRRRLLGRRRGADPGRLPVHRLPQRQDRAERQRAAQDHGAAPSSQGRQEAEPRTARPSRPRWPPPATWSTLRRVTCFLPNSPSAQRLWVNPSASRWRCSTTRRCSKGGYGGVIGVGQGSSRPPRLVRLIHRGSKLAKTTEAGQEGGAGRQGHHVRHRRHLDQAGGVDAPHDLGHGRRRRGHRHRGAGRAAGTADRRDRHRADGREHAVGDRAAPRRRADAVRRNHRRGAQHRRRGPAHPGRRHRAGVRGQPGLPDRDVHADRCADGGAGRPHTRGDGQRRVPRPGRRDLAARWARTAGRCRCPTNSRTT